MLFAKDILGDYEKENGSLNNQEKIKEILIIRFKKYRQISVWFESLHDKPIFNEMNIEVE